MLRRAAITVGWLVFFFAASFSGLAENSQSQSLNVPRDVVSISEIRPSVTPTPKSSHTESLKRKLTKLHKQKFRTTQASHKVLREKLRKLGWHATPREAQRIAWILTKPRHWHGREWQCLKKLWDRESSWEWDSDNPSSEAYGVPQALPGSKMASMGKDWFHNAYTQIRWGLKYIKDRYLTPCGALAHSDAYNWY